jgi:single-strand DNA-binding protein
MNTVVLIGRLVRDPELKFTQSGKAVCSFTLAVDKPFGDKEADFIPIVVWGKIGEACGNNLGKGRLVAVEGRLQIRSYEKDGNKHRIAEVVASEVKFLDYGKKNEKPANKTSDGPDWGKIDLDDLPF